MKFELNRDSDHFFDSAGEKGDRVGVYYGTGASHSWVWMVEALRAIGLPLEFLDENDVSQGRLSACRAFVVSGGDTFALAGALGSRGAREIGAFVHRGGTYLGTCAGACLALRSSHPPLSEFDFVPARIANISSRLPEPFRDPERYSTPYGDGYVFQPVREEVRVGFPGGNPLGFAGEVVVPLYGGPSLLPPQGDRSIFPDDAVSFPAYYEGFTPRTLFLTDRSLAGRVLLGRGAVAVSGHGEGRFVLCGPHFEHPRYPDGLKVLASALKTGTAAIYSPIFSGQRPQSARTSFRRDLRIELSNCRVLAMGMERAGMEWKIGGKFYDAGKVLTFLACVWKRSGVLSGSEEEEEKILSTARTVRRLLHDATIHGVGGKDILSALKELTVLVLRACEASSCTTHPA